MRAPKRFAIWSFSSSSSGRIVVVAKEEKDTQNTQKKKKQRMKTDKNALYWPFLALFQGKELCLAYVVNSF